MLARPMDVLTAFPVRKTKKQKEAFRSAVQSYAEKLDYSCRIEKGSFGCRNIVIGDADKAKYLVTAHYDTCARMLLPNFITPCNIGVYAAYQILIVAIIVLISAIAGWIVGEVAGDSGSSDAAAFIVYWLLLLLMLFGPANPSNANDNTSGIIALLEILKTMPENQRHKVCFVLFDLEEAGLIGSSSYRERHKEATNRQIVLNMDCVGDGDYLMMFPTKRLRSDKRKLTSLYKACGYFGRKSLLVYEKAGSIYPSDQINFPYGVGIAAFHKKKHLGFFYSRIHTPRDIILEETNINILRAALTSFITCDAAQ